MERINVTLFSNSIFFAFLPHCPFGSFHVLLQVDRGFPQYKHCCSLPSFSTCFEPTFLFFFVCFYIVCEFYSLQRLVLWLWMHIVCYCTYTIICVNFLCVCVFFCFILLCVVFNQQSPCSCAALQSIK